MSLCSYMEKGSEAYSATIQIFLKTRVNEICFSCSHNSTLAKWKFGVGDGKEDYQGKDNDYALFLS